MRKYAARRLALGIPTILGAALLIFAIMRIAPGDVASMIAIVPIPLVPPWTSRVSPSRAQPRSNTLCHTVNNVSGMAAASAIDMPSGTCKQCAACARQYSA